MKEFEVVKGNLYPLGALPIPGGIQFSSPLRSVKESGVVLISRANGEKKKIPFSSGMRVGNIASIIVKNISPQDYEYLFYDGEDEYVDPYAKLIYGNEVWGFKNPDTYSLRGGFASLEYDWAKDIPLCIPFDKSIIYCLHVRGFTAHKSSKVSGKGTFKGLMNKIPYLKELGVTAVELMPAYEFEEYEVPKSTENDYLLSVSDSYLQDFTSKKEEKLNYWGFKNAFYFAPKSSYSSSLDPVREMKDMIKAFHENGIEVIMQFYFPDEVKQGLIFDVIKYWITVYHIDGVHLKGLRIPIELICTEPLFANTKILYDKIPVDSIYQGQEIPAYRNMCLYSDDFMVNIRRFLKGDDNTIKEFARIYTGKSNQLASVNYVTNYYGFTLADLFSYNQKHNEGNGEGNTDGNDYNYSWNCGVEGKTRKSSIIHLRKRMMKNALTALLTSQGTPVIMAGDERCNSQNGNNNPYCQDNEISYINWTENRLSEEILLFTKQLIHFRETLGFIQSPPFTMLDYLRCGYPDLSYHGEEAYRADFNHYNRNIAVMFNSLEGNVPVLTYIAFNMYWEHKCFALPKLLKNQKWKLILSTGKACIWDEQKESVSEETQESKTDIRSDKIIYEIEDRSVAIFQSCIK